jgi:hypothetical protein
MYPLTDVVLDGRFLVVLSMEAYRRQSAKPCDGDGSLDCRGTVAGYEAFRYVVAQNGRPVSVLKS